MIGPYRENTIVVGDCLDVMAKMPDSCVDLVVTDPPYNIGKLVNMPKDEYLIWCTKWARELARVTTATSSLYICFARQWFPEFYLILRDDLGLLDRRILIHHFRNAGLIRPTSWKSTYDVALYFTQSDVYTFNVNKQWTDEYFDVHTIARPQSNFTDKRIHPTQKPLEFMRRIVAVSSNLGDLIFDPFMGSGTTAVAADRLGRRWFGCDIHSNYVEMALGRIDADRQKRAQLVVNLF